MTRRARVAAMAALFLFAGAMSGATGAAGARILFLAGPRDHGMPGRHEYERDLRTLAQSLEASTNLKGVSTEVRLGRLPQDPALLDGVAAIVIDSSSDRAADETHPLFPPNPSTNGRGYDEATAAWLKSFDDKISRQKIGVVIFHYANWVENWRAREYVLGWTGGLWVQIGSKNPQDDWRMDLLNKRHPILRGVRPWAYRDEIFCRFLLPNDVRRTDLIRATPKQDKFHVGPQVAAWAYQRDDGGRGFVFGGLDFRDNLARDDYRKFLLNSIAWAANLEVPTRGVESPAPDVSDVTPRATR